MVDQFGTMAKISVAISADGKSYTELDSAWVLQFDSKSAGKYETQAIDYTYPVPGLDAVRFVKITASAPGHYAIRAITLHQGQQTWTVKTVISDGRTEHAGSLLTGGQALLGHPNPKALFQQLLAAGDSSKVFSVEHGSLVVELAGDEEITHLLL